MMKSRYSRRSHGDFGMIGEGKSRKVLGPEFGRVAPFFRCLDLPYSLYSYASITFSFRPAKMCSRDVFALSLSRFKHGYLLPPLVTEVFSLVLCWISPLRCQSIYSRHSLLPRFFPHLGQRFSTIGRRLKIGSRSLCARPSPERLLLKLPQS